MFSHVFTPRGVISRKKFHMSGPLLCSSSQNFSLGQYKIDFQLDFDRFRKNANQYIIVMGALLCKEIDEQERKSREMIQTYSIPVYQPGKVKDKMD